MRLDMLSTVKLIADSLVCTCVQLIVLSIVAGTLLIRPIMYTNSVPDGQLFVSLPFAMMVGLMMDNFSEMSITLESMHVMFIAAGMCILGDLFLDLAATQSGRTYVCLTQKSDVDQMLQQQQQQH